MSYEWAGLKKNFVINKAVKFICTECILSYTEYAQSSTEELKSL